MVDLLGLTVIIMTVINTIIMIIIIIKNTAKINDDGAFRSLNVLKEVKHEDQRFCSPGYRGQRRDRAGVRPRVAKKGRNKNLSRRARPGISAWAIRRVEQARSNRAGRHKCETS